MALADASRVQLLMSPEVAFAEVPSSPNMGILRLTSENIKHNNATVVSDEIRSDRSRSDLLLVGTDVAGDINCDMSFGTYDTLLEGALCGTWATNVLKNGTTFKSYLLERGLLDVGQYFSYRGSAINGFHLTVQARRIITATFNVMGAAGYVGTTSLDATPTAASTTSVMAAGPVVAGLELNTNMTGIKATEVRIDLTNNMRARPDVESRASAQFGMGAQDVTGRILYYFENKAIYDVFLANTSQALSFDIKDPDSGTKKYTFSFPKIKYTDFEATTPGVERDIIATAQFRALYDGTALCQMSITRVTV